MTDPNNTFTTPVGRIVGGSLSEPFTTDHNGNPCDPKWVVVLALPKSDLGTQALITKIKAIGAAGYADKQAALDRADFAWKYVNGDANTPNTKGVVYNTRVGYPGHYVFTFTNSKAPSVCGEDPRSEINAASVKRGDWVRIGGSIGCGTRTDQPGIFLNVDCAQFVRADEAIGSTGQTCAQAFGSSATPPPATDLVNAAAGGPPPPPPGAAPPPPADGPQLTPAGVAAGCDPAAWLTAAQPWTLEQMRTAGYVV